MPPHSLLCAAQLLPHDTCCDSVALGDWFWLVCYMATGSAALCMHFLCLQYARPVVRWRPDDHQCTDIVSPCTDIVVCSPAMCCVLYSPAGVSDEGLQVKQSVVQEALAVNKELIQQGPLQALQAVGGLEVAAMTGAYLEAAKRGMPAVVDGYISGKEAGFCSTTLANTAALRNISHQPGSLLPVHVRLWHS